MNINKHIGTLVSSRVLSPHFTYMKPMTTYTIKNIVVPLTFIFSPLKAESINSAFINVYYSQQKDSASYAIKKYEVSQKLYETRNYEKSLKYCLSILEGESDTYVQILTNSLLAKIARKTDDKEKYIFYLKNSIHLIQSYNKAFPPKLKDTLNDIFSDNLLKLGGAYQRISKIDSATYFYKEIEKINSTSNQTIINKGKALSNLSGIYTHYDKNRNLVLAKKYIQKAIKTSENIKEKGGLSANYGILASIYEYQNNITKAKEYYLKAINLVEKLDDNSDDVLRNKEVLYENYAWVLYKLKDYRAFDYLEKSYITKEKLNNAKLQADIKRIEVRHNIDLIKKEEEYKRIKLERNNWAIAILGVLISLFLIYFINLYKLRQKNLKLQLSQKELEQQKKLEKLKSESQVKIINAAIDGRESERKQIAETLHDNVSALLSSANMHLQAFQKQSNSELPIELEKTQNIILDASQKIRDLSHNLVSSILLKFGLQYAIKDIAKKYSNSSLQIHTAISDLGRYSQQFEIKVFNIIQELLNNILKHSKATKAFVVIEEKDNQLYIVVKDNGQGITSEENLNSGIGIHQIKARVAIMKGSFDIDSKRKKGTKVTIEVPVYYS